MIQEGGNQSGSEFGKAVPLRKDDVSRVGDIHLAFGLVGPNSDIVLLSDAHREDDLDYGVRYMKLSEKVLHITDIDMKTELSAQDNNDGRIAVTLLPDHIVHAESLKYFAMWAATGGFNAMMRQDTFDPFKITLEGDNRAWPLESVTVRCLGLYVKRRSAGRSQRHLRIVP